MDRIVFVQKPPDNNYGCFSFLLDVLMLCLTCGLWIIWIFVREMRKGS